MIKLNNISVKYDKEIIHPCDISFEDGKLILIKGESGAGKTSLLYRIGYKKVLYLNNMMSLETCSCMLL